MPKEKRRRNKRRRNKMPRKFKRPRSSSGSSSDRKQQRRVDAVISQAAPIIATTAILASQGHFSEAGSSSGPQPSTSGATSTSGSNVPMVCPKPALMNCLQKVGARGTCFTRKEVLKYLIQYIGERMLYDQNNPRVVYCRDDELGKALGVPQFTIYNVKDVLAANCVPVTSPQVIQADTKPTTASQAKVHYTLQHSVAEGREPAAIPKSAQAKCQDDAMPGPSTVPQKAKEKRKHRRRNKLSESEKSTSSTGSSTRRRRRHSSSLSIGQTLQLDEEGPKGLPWFYFVKCPKESEKRSSGSCTERWSIDGYSTAYVADSSDDLWFLEEDSDREEVIDWEFELDSDSSEPYNDDDDEEDSDIDGEEEEYYVEMIRCSDNDSCMADESEESTDEEITDKDKWKCDKCPMRNSPYQRYCSHCWALRKDWFPEVHNSSQKSTLQRSNSCPEAQSMESADTAGTMDPSPGVVSPPERTISTDSAFSSLGSSSQEVNSTPGATGVSQDHVGAVVMEPCMICLSRPKVASMVHGRTAHLVCCYTCAKKLYKRGKPCPVCRRPIQMVVKTFFA